MDQKSSFDAAPHDSGRLDAETAGGTTRRALIGTAMAGAAAGALSSRMPLARAAGNSSGRRYSLPKGAYRIDLHTHYIPPEYAAFLASKKVVSVPWSVEAQLKFMDTWGIEKSVVSAPQPFDYGDPAETRQISRGINEYGRMLLDEYGDRYGIHATLPMPNIADSIDELSYAFDTLKLNGGVMLFCHYNGVYLGDPAFEELYAELNRRGLVVWVHPSFPVEEPVGPFAGQVLEFPFETTRAATLILYNRLLDKYPNIKWQLSHAGGTLPYILTRLAFGQEVQFYFKQLTPLENGPIEEARRFYYDTALGGSDEQMMAVDHLAGPSHVLFGTDWPFTAWMFGPDAHEIAPWWDEDLPTAKGDPEPVLSRVFRRPERMRIERGNAADLYPGLVAP